MRSKREVRDWPTSCNLITAYKYLYYCCNEKNWRMCHLIKKALNGSTYYARQYYANNWGKK